MPIHYILFACLTLMATSAWAQVQPTWPSRPVKVIMPGPPGSGSDVFARWYANELQKTLNQPFVVENRAGASGIIGTDAVAKAEPDGSTILFGYNQLVTMNPHLFAKLPYDPDRDLAPISIIGKGTYVIVANNDLPAKNLAEVVALAKKEPGKLSYGTYGLGTAFHLGMEMIQDATGIQLTHVPYRGGMITDVMSGQIALGVEPVGSATPLIKAGSVKAIAVTGTKRSDALPDVPTVAETIPGYELVGWMAIWVPAKTPAPVVQKLQDEVIRITKLPETAQRLRELGNEPVGTTASEMAATIQRETESWGKVIKAKGIRLD